MQEYTREGESMQMDDSDLKTDLSILETKWHKIEIKTSNINQ
ncbi:hypothetical protein [Dysgonomonas sp. HGC4]|nr:hypothetical protein [Dysgonomonas sp. HGC4]